MQNLPTEVLAVVLNCLENASDLMRCSAVCKIWATGADKARPTALSFYHHHLSTSEDDGVGHTKWLQAWQTQGRLENLQNVTWAENKLEAHANSSFCRRLLSYAGLWNLHTCCLDGLFCFSAAVRLLPTTLKHLRLFPDVAPKSVRMSRFERLIDLEHLTMGHFRRGCVPSDPYGMSFFVDKCLMSHLMCLDLSPSGDIAYTLAPKSIIVGCFSRLKALHARAPFHGF